MSTKQRRGGWATLAAAAIAALIAASFATVALAQEDDQTRARASFQLGVERFGDGSYESALEAFQEAYRLRPHPAVRVNMANCYERLGRPVEALFHYERFLTEAPPDLLAGRQAEVRRAIAALERQVGHLVLELAPAAARARIDGEAVQTTAGTPVRLIAGDHRLEVTADGYRPHSETFRAVAGERTTITVELRRGAGGGATAVSVSGEGGPPRRPGGRGRPPGGGGARGGQAEAAPPPEHTEPDTGGGGGSRFLSTPFLIAGGAAVALFVGGTVTGAMALGADSDFDATARRIERGDYANDEDLAALQRQGRDDASSADTLALTSDILLVSSLVAGGFAVYFLVTYEEDDGGSQRASARLRAIPVAGPDAAGLVLRGDF
ncbi:MAG: tetratricopeptide repeat protein [Deltaproteobacteria bacterium]|nr:tetratricopeptide repeat protein [Deltaproteobacteria bacterium]